jgi:riboflavin kinase / FMN adenylyltransferase
MLLLSGLNSSRLAPLFSKGAVATIGNFDGVHRGHQSLIARLKAAAQRLDLPSVVIVFEPQPNEYFNTGGVTPRIMSLNEKIIAFRKLGVAAVCVLKFNHRLSSMDACDFVHQIVNAFSLKHWIIGDDFRFGKARVGDVQLLKSMGEPLGFSVEQSHSLIDGGDRISSTRVRFALQAGDLSLVNQLLGHAVYFTGKVVYGNQLGRTLGLPTANFSRRQRMFPVSGVFIVSVSRCAPVLFTEGDENTSLGVSESRLAYGVANIGYRPTVNSKSVARLEVHLLDFSGDLYGQRLYVTLHHKVREEQRFESIDQLKSAIEADIQYARTWLMSN